MVRRLHWLACVCLAIAASAPASAHHSFAAEFDENATAELKGQIAQVWWNNPHVRYRPDDQSEGRLRRRLGAASVEHHGALGARLERNAH